MEIAHACQVQIQELINQNFDLIIFANKPTERSTFLFKNYSLRAARILTLINSDSKEIRKEGRELNQSHSVDQLNISSTDGERIVEYIDSLTIRLKKNELTILIDYSCMTKFWYAAIINYLYLKEITCERVFIYFVYIPVSFSEPRKREFRRDLQVILKDPIYVNLNITQKALVLGLGYDMDSSEFIIHKLNPDIIFYLVSQPAIDEKYSTKVLDLNYKLIQNQPGNLIPYPMLDMDRTVELLTKLVLDLRLNYKVILASSVQNYLLWHAYYYLHVFQILKFFQLVQNIILKVMIAQLTHL